MVRSLHVEKLVDCSKKTWLGAVPKREDYTEVISEDTDVYLPDGTLALVFRKGVLSQVKAAVPGTEDYAYWRWACRSLNSDQRGFAAGKEITTNVEIRFTQGQLDFFKAARKGLIKDLSTAQEIVKANTSASRYTYYIGKTETDGLVDLEEIEKWASIARKKSTSFEEKQEAIAKRNKAKLAWFDNWLTGTWAVAEDKKSVAEAAWKRYNTNQPRSNKAYSAVLGTIDRSSRTPFGRLTKPTVDRYEDFLEQGGLVKEIDDEVRKAMPEQWKVLHERFKDVKDQRYNLFGTVFTSITCNWNFDVAYHYDGNNAKDAVAALTVFENGSYKGGEFVLPELGLAFDIRHGDLLAGDNQGLLHGMIPLEFTSENDECLMLVLYQRDALIKLDDLECETCRKDFMAWSKDNLKHMGTGEKNWAGSFPGAWSSPWWMQFKKDRGMERCSNTNYWGNLDDWDWSEEILTETVVTL